MTYKLTTMRGVNPRRGTGGGRFPQIGSGRDNIRVLCCVVIAVFLSAFIILLWFFDLLCRLYGSYYYAPVPRVGALSDDARLTSVYLSRTSGLSREQRGLGRPKFAQR